MQAPIIVDEQEGQLQYKGAMSIKKISKRYNQSFLILPTFSQWTYCMLKQHRQAAKEWKLTVAGVRNQKTAGQLSREHGLRQHDLELSKLADSRIPRAISGERQRDCSKGQREL